MFRFLGSLSFAIGLIAATVVFVVAGTLLESWSQSHLFAAAFTYHNPLFQLLLWLYFINILFSALSRYPFEKKHIPFLLTHLGLLLLLSGVFVKNHFGVQGACALTEGGGSSYIFVPGSYALQIENREGISLVRVPQGGLGPLESGMDLELTVVEWIPHAEERLEGFIKGGWGHIVGLPPFEMQAEGAALVTPEYAIYAQQEEGEVTFPGRASLFFIQDKEKREKLVAFDGQGERYEQPLDSQAYFIYNKGYGGYALFAELPSHFPPIDLIAPLTRTWRVSPMPTKREEATPRIRLLASSGGHSEVVTLGFDRYGQSFKWPILNGQYLIRFQADRTPLPMHVRLQRARQINYPGTNQPYSYEATIRVDGEEAQLSMNHVYEKKGYRFYLANLIASPSGAHQVQIVVNHDPAKYWLTYPGAIILALGILLLYLRRRYV